MNNNDLPLFQTQNESPGATTSAMTVSALTAKIKRNLEDEFTEIWVQGEISNLKEASSGHVYFSLKDEGAGFAMDTNKITLIDRNNNIKEFPLKNKNDVAIDIVQKIIELSNA